MEDNEKVAETAVPLPKQAIEDGLRAEGIDPNAPPPPGHEASECPKCHHRFWHKIGHALGKAAEGLGDAIGEAKFGG